MFDCTSLRETHAVVMLLKLLPHLPVMQTRVTVKSGPFTAGKTRIFKCVFKCVLKYSQTHICLRSGRLHVEGLFRVTRLETSFVICTSLSEQPSTISTLHNLGSYDIRLSVAACVGLALSVCVCARVCVHLCLQRAICH